MRKLILTYLTKNYKLGELAKKHVGLYLKLDEESLKYSHELLSELSDIFALDEDALKELVNFWAKGNDLNFYWEFKGLFFANVANVVAGLVGTELVSVQPMAGPSGVLTYLDYVYSGTPEPNSNGRIYERPLNDQLVTLFNSQVNMISRGEISSVSHRYFDDEPRPDLES